MGGVNVKNTMIEALLRYIAPHPCFGCGKIGSVLCDYCKYDIVTEGFCGCFLCGKPAIDGICNYHDSPIQKSFIVSQRTGVVETLINALKFHHVKAAAIAAAELLHNSLPILPSNTVIVPIPTVSSHVRQRGYDQVELIAKHFAFLRSLYITPLLNRNNSATQHKLGREERFIEARSAFVINSSLKPVADAPILILDDIITTGSTVSEAARIISNSYKTVWIGAVAYQPLD